LFGLGLFFGGACAFSVALPVLWMRRTLGGASALAFLTAMALFMTWLAVTGGGSGRAHPPARPGSLVFGPEVGELVMRAFAWLFAIPLDVIALVAWVVAVRWLVRRPPPCHPPRAGAKTRPSPRNVLPDQEARMPRFVFLLAVVALTVAFGGELAPVGGQATSGEYKIGVLEPITGPLAFEGKRHVLGLEIVRHLINAPRA